MAAVLSIIFSGIILAGFYKLLTRAEARRSFIQSVRDDPLNALFTTAWVACWMVFFWGVFIPRFGELPLLGLKVWQIGGIGSLVGLILCSSVRRLSF